MSEIRKEIFGSFNLTFQRNQGEQILEFWAGVTELEDDLKFLRFRYFKNCFVLFLGKLLEEWLHIRNLYPWIFKLKLLQQWSFSGHLPENQNHQPFI